MKQDQKIWVRQLKEYLGEFYWTFQMWRAMDEDDIGKEVNNWGKADGGEKYRVKQRRSFIGVRETRRMRVYTAMDMARSLVSM